MKSATATAPRGAERLHRAGGAAAASAGGAQPAELTGLSQKTSSSPAPSPPGKQNPTTPEAPLLQLVNLLSSRGKIWLQDLKSHICRKMVRAELRGRLNLEVPNALSYQQAQEDQLPSLDATRATEMRVASTVPCRGEPCSPGLMAPRAPGEKELQKHHGLCPAGPKLWLHPDVPRGAETWLPATSWARRSDARPRTCPSPGAQTPALLLPGGDAFRISCPPKDGEKKKTPQVSKGRKRRGWGAA